MAARPVTHASRPGPAKAAPVDGRTHQIGEVAMAVGLSLCTIRHYEQAALVPPSGRTAGGLRRRGRGRLREAARPAPLGPGHGGQVAARGVPDGALVGAPAVTPAVAAGRAAAAEAARRRAFAIVGPTVPSDADPAGR